MSDFSTYSALSGRKDWSQVRNDRQNEIIYLKQMQQDLQNRIQQEAQSRAGVVEYMSQINQASVLEQDLGRVKGVEAEARKKIVEGLKAAGNDYNKFLLGNGAATLQEYYNTVMKSDEMQAAVNNKLVYAQSMLDNYMGRKARPVTITLSDGTQKQVSMSEQMKMFDEGAITKMNYAGSVQPTDLIKIQQAIQQTFGKNPYKRQQANREDIYEYALRFGAEDWEANQLADAYEAGVVEGAETPIYYNYKEAPKQSGASYLKKMAGRYGAADLDLLASALNGAFQDKVIVRKTYTNKEGKQGNEIETETDISTVPELMGSVMNMANVQKITDKEGKTSYFYKGNGYGAKSESIIDLSGADLDFGDAKLSTISRRKEGDEIDAVEFAGQQYFPNSSANGIPLLKVKASFDSKGDAIRAGALDNYGGREAGNFKSENGRYEGYVFIPIDDSVKSRIFNRPKQDAQTKYKDIYDYEYMQLMQQLDEQGIDMNDILSAE